MKKLLLLSGLFVAVAAFAQNREEISVLAGTRTVHKTVFGIRDSLSLEKLFSEKLSYGHPGGKVESKKEAIGNILRNQSVYEKLELGATSLWISDKTAVTRNTITVNERTVDGQVRPLKLHIMLVWAKEKGGWKLIARQAVELTHI